MIHKNIETSYSGKAVDFLANDIKTCLSDESA